MHIQPKAGRNWWSQSDWLALCNLCQTAQALSVRQEHSWYFSQQRFQEELANGFAVCNVHGIKSLCEFSLKQSVFGILLCYKLYLMYDLP